MNNLQDIIRLFFSISKENHVDLYNEFSFQHEFGCFLRCIYKSNYLVQFERPTSFFNIENRLEKKEIDISIFKPDFTKSVAIELKFPRNGQYPEQMFSAIKDLRFLEQLVASGFKAGYIIFLADDPLFYSGDNVENIYAYFRNGLPISGEIRKPTGLQHESVFINGSYVVEWINVINTAKYFSISVIQ